jgi:hypothetical protein
MVSQLRSLFASGLAVSRAQVGTVTLALGCLMNTGCATLIHGSRQDVSVESQPLAAEIRVTRIGDGAPRVVYSGRTPAQVPLAREGHYSVVVQSDGYQDVTVDVDRSFSGWVLGNLLCGLLGGLLVGGVIDYVTGAFWQLDPDGIVVTLLPNKRGTTSLEGSEGADAFALLFAKDSNGELRSLAIPMVRR